MNGTGSRILNLQCHGVESAMAIKIIIISAESHKLLKPALHIHKEP